MDNSRKNGLSSEENVESSPRRQKKRKNSIKDKIWIMTKRRLPILAWLPKYNWKTDFVSDFFAGLTMALINVPQALAFAVLANAPLISGMYTACFSALVYAFLGTARVSAFGPVAVGSMLTGESVAVYMTGKNMSAPPDGTVEDYDMRVTYIASLTFTIGLMYLSFFILRMSVIRVLFSKAFVTGFISGCCVHIFTKSLKMILKLKIKSHYGYFVVYKNLRDLVLKIPDTHVPTLLFSIVVIAVLLSNTFILKKLVAKITTFIVPMEAVVLIASVVVSYYFDLPKYGFDTVGYIPNGIPNFSPFDPMLLPTVVPDAVTIATINYATSMSMVIAFNPGILKANQETLAMAASNLLCSNIQCITIGNSMMRTIVAINLGIKSQLSTIISCTILLFVLLFAGPLIEPLPTAVLGCIIVLAIGQLLVTNLLAVPAIFRISLEDGLIWMSVFLTTVFLDMQIGLITGFVLTLRQLLVRIIGEDEEKERRKEAAELEAVESKRPENEKLLERGRKLSLSDQ